MTRNILSRSGIGLAGVVACLTVAPGIAQATNTRTTTGVDTSACSATPAVAQPFLSFGDSNWYTLVPGQLPNSFSGAGWTLTGGASVVTTTISGGASGTVLNLPSGSQAVSPTICVNNEYPIARTMVRNVTGNEGVNFSVSYETAKTWTKPQNAGNAKGNGTAWTLSNKINTHATNSAQWQLVRFTLVPGGTKHDFQIYNFYVDPRMH
jgi:hypothetical protein